MCALSSRGANNCAAFSGNHTAIVIIQPRISHISITADRRHREATSVADLFSFRSHRQSEGLVHFHLYRITVSGSALVGGEISQVAALMEICHHCCRFKSNVINAIGTELPSISSESVTIIRHIGIRQCKCKAGAYGRGSCHCRDSRRLEEGQMQRIHLCTAVIVSMFVGIDIGFKIFNIINPSIRTTSCYSI